MFRILAAVVLAGALSACAQMPQWSWSKGFAKMDFAPRAQSFNFDWALSGDPQIAPLQVFDDGRRTWLQFAADQVLPAMFRRTERGDILLKASRDGAYLVLDGVWPHVLVRGGHLVAHVRRSARTPQQVSDMPASSLLSAPSMAETPEVLNAAEAIPLAPLVLSVPLIEPELRSESETRSEPEFVLGASSAVPDIGWRMSKGHSEFAASPDDGNLRLALVRWAGMAGWTFGPEHWAVDVDIPLAGAARFGTVFKPAVRQLLAATELGDRPLQPCFYANQVLRVVPFAQRCDRSLAPGAV